MDVLNDLMPGPGLLKSFSRIQLMFWLDPDSTKLDRILGQCMRHYISKNFHM